MDLALRADGTGLAAEVTASLSAAIGSVHAVLDGVGISATLGFPASGGNLGIADLALGFKGPDGIGLTVDAHGVLSGGGFLRHDATQGSYAGVMQLSLHERLTLTAFGLLTTRLPDGSRGYSLLVFITAETSARSLWAWASRCRPSAACWACTAPSTWPSARGHAERHAEVAAVPARRGGQRAGHPRIAGCRPKTARWPPAPTPARPPAARNAD